MGDPHVNLVKFLRPGAKKGDARSPLDVVHAAVGIITNRLATALARHFGFKEFQELLDLGKDKAPFMQKWSPTSCVAITTNVNLDALVESLLTQGAETLNISKWEVAEQMVNHLIPEGPSERAKFDAAAKLGGTALFMELKSKAEEPTAKRQLKTLLGNALTATAAAGATAAAAQRQRERDAAARRVAAAAAAALVVEPRAQRNGIAQRNGNAQQRNFDGNQAQHNANGNVEGAAPVCPFNNCGGPHVKGDCPNYTCHGCKRVAPGHTWPNCETPLEGHSFRECRGRPKNYP
jgi:hypothetical protein